MATLSPWAGPHSSAQCCPGHLVVAEENSWKRCRSEVKCSSLPYGQIQMKKGPYRMNFTVAKQEVPTPCPGRWNQSGVRLKPGLFSHHTLCTSSAMFCSQDFTLTPPSFVPGSELLLLHIHLLFVCNTPSSANSWSGWAWEFWCWRLATVVWGIGYRATAKYSSNMQTNLGTLRFSWCPANPSGHEGYFLQVLFWNNSLTL